MKRSYAALMTLYPPEYRLLFADEMVAVFEEASRERKSRGWTCYLAFLAGEVCGLVRGAAVEWSGRWYRRPSHRAFAFSAGAMISLLYLGPLLRIRHLFPGGEQLGFVRRVADSETLELLVLAATSVVLIAAFSIAFVINLRSVAHRRQSKA